MVTAMRPDQARELVDVFNDENIGHAISSIRRTIAKQSQSDFASDFGLTRDKLAFIEAGRTPINVELGWLLCKQFNIHPAWLMSCGMEDVPPRFDDIPSWKIAFLETRLRGNGKILFRQFWRMLGWAVMEKDLHAKIFQKMMLTDTETHGNLSEVKEQMPNLRRRLNLATKETGKMSALAKFLGRQTNRKIPLASVSRWLSGKREPGGEITLKLLRWVEQQERQK